MKSLLDTVDIEISNNHIVTHGLFKYNSIEILLTINNDLLLNKGYEDFLKYIVNYIIDNRVKVKPEETLSYGYWLVKFKLLNNDFLDIWELNKEATDFVKGANFSIKFWIEQNEICKKFNVLFTPSTLNTMVVISDGVYEGEAVQGVRYPSPSHMSGWWITTDKYNGDTNTLRTEHIFHLFTKRPDLIKYLALPYGYRFDLSSFEDIWFDEEAATEQD